MNKEEIMKKKEEMRRVVAAKFSEDNVRPEEIILRDNGEIVIDRSATYPWVKPVIVGEWS